MDVQRNVDRLSPSAPDHFVKRLGIVFRERREAAGVSKKALAEAAHVSRTGIIMFERGERIPTLFVCKALADALGTSLADLVRSAE